MAIDIIKKRDRTATTDPSDLVVCVNGQACKNFCSHKVPHVRDHHYCSWGQECFGMPYGTSSVCIANTGADQPREPKANEG